ncbi:bifunctional 4-hydroxy-3-methylbut-2-enyl diphosphate reductase/30S ribosomal protein S1 [Clostridium cochlearium]|uniref:4-hydroxy-3-methylbut-2-enyl diphosphate reductase n=1 Tax=Clostridium cochlearium TaxID=1494 RepID=A0ABY0QK16_CLOCO|nr:bifunctional 4-hydroxy-3-methylbut-2-enyl diphosphate reductase/30S ribosomal protein S1 [Clostridium cochlearium]MBV1819568.1 bifunctional 4-hydroxy-3-methylbut-2-enyl diphosphate reductase/30S ribosomal protein S1 [Bacteroidales bacterium MSK.15.36]MCG4570882.1 bifunctional 4-hydroxy-3-methylbut-2-enyl diphosphate reductase/30S ribosomal protein S1 [Clostridium cochlearium]MCG4580803.1 bifunctional 4-hydroxy-3-methylbut-2-enyl diphosphate reductase/30S ribosomal protein S1 [Clostridium coch
MSIILAKKSGFCYGVKRAVDTCLKLKDKYTDKKIYTLGPLIHNNDVVNFLKKQNIYPIDYENINTLKEGDIIILRSHGVTLETIEKLKEKKLNIIDATCPYVSNIQKKVQKYYEKGYSILIVGDKNHPEVIGINGWCNNSAIICKNAEEIENLPAKICVVSQTTEKKEHWVSVLSKVVNECREIIAFNTICNATEVRQLSAKELSKEVDFMVVIGSKSSSNTTKLYEICKTNCVNTIHVENAGELPDYISNKYYKIGVTAGASTPDWIIKEAIFKMSNKDLNEQLEYMNNNDIQISIGQEVEGEVVSIVSNSEAYVNIGYKSDAILPLSEITKESDEDINNFIKKGDIIKGKIIKLGSENKPPVISVIELNREKAYIELKEAFENKEKVVVKVKEDVNGGLISIYKNIIRVFIPASHVELRHVNDLSVYKGQELTVNIIEFEEGRNNTRIVGSRRDLLKEGQLKIEEETWASLEKDTVKEGEVRRLTNFGAFVNIDGVDGLLHVSEISWGRVEKPSDMLKVGDKIKVYIKDIDKENRKLALSIKDLTEDPWKNVDVKYPVGNIVLGTVVRFASFGAFVELEPGVDGLIHISQISHKRIDKVEDELSIGQQVKAKIVEVDGEKRKIGLSIKEVNDI